jgi:hypothetical protein
MQHLSIRFKVVIDISLSFSLHTSSVGNPVSTMFTHPGHKKFIFEVPEVAESNLS